MASQRVSRVPHSGKHVVSISGLVTFSAVAASWHFSLPLQTSSMSLYGPLSIFVRGLSPLSAS